MRPIKLFDVLLQKTKTRDSEAQSYKLANYLTVYNDMSKVAETRDQTVQNQFLGGLEKVFFGKEILITKDNSNYTLMKYGCDKGPASEGSTPDAYLIDSTGCIRGIFEVKHSVDSPQVPLRQAVPQAINVAIMQLNIKQAKWDEVMVFVIGSNGYLLQLGVVFILYPSFPVFVSLTSCLDLTDHAMRSKACEALNSIKKWIVSHPVVVSEPGTSIRKGITGMGALSTLRYHVKPLKGFFSSLSNTQSSLFHYFRVMTRLHEECRPYVVFPICVREYENNPEESCIVFPNMHDYHIGFPEEEDLRRLYFVELKKAIECFHKAGVVHLDLYQSNIMWK
jgi:serine/threonine protein kinase